LRLGRRRSEVVIIVLLILLGVGILQSTYLGLHPGEAWRLVLRLSRLRSILFPLLVEAASPLLHHFLVLELDHEILHAGITLPPYLYRVGAWRDEKSE
jgi:hypothetical protein